MIGLTDHRIVTERVISVLKTHDKLNAFYIAKSFNLLKKRDFHRSKTAALLTYLPCTRSYIDNK